MPPETDGLPPDISSTAVIHFFSCLFFLPFSRFFGSMLERCTKTHVTSRRNNIAEQFPDFCVEPAYFWCRGDSSDSYRQRKQGYSSSSLGIFHSLSQSLPVPLTKNCVNHIICQCVVSSRVGWSSMDHRLADAVHQPQDCFPSPSCPTDKRAENHGVYLTKSPMMSWTRVRFQPCVRGASTAPFIFNRQFRPVGRIALSSSDFSFILNPCLLVRCPSLTVPSRK